MKKPIQVPFDLKGMQLTYADPYGIKNGRIEMKDNYEFDTVLFYNGFSRGRSALNIEWKDHEGKTYQSGMSLLNSFLLDGKGVTKILNERLHITGKFTFKKQGTAYLLTVAND